MWAGLAHAEYCMGAFLDARNLCPKLSLTNKKELDPRLSDDIPDRAMFYTVRQRRRPSPPRTAAASRASPRSFTRAASGWSGIRGSVTRSELQALRRWPFLPMTVHAMMFADA